MRQTERYQDVCKKLLLSWKLNVMFWAELMHFKVSYGVNDTLRSLAMVIVHSRRWFFLSTCFT